MARPGGSSLPGLGRCCDCSESCSCADGCSKCAQQLIVTVLPQEILDWLNAVAAQHAGPGCGTPPTPPSSVDYDAAMDSANAILASFDWDSPPVSWSGNERTNGFCDGIEPCIHVVRRELFAVDGFIDGTHGYDYHWNNDTRHDCDSPWPNYVWDIFGDQKAIWSGFSWANFDINNACSYPNNFCAGYPVLISSYTRLCGFDSVCRGQRHYAWTGSPDYNTFSLIDAARCCEDLSVGTSPTCGIVTPGSDGWIYPSNGRNGEVGARGFAPCVLGRPYPDDWPGICDGGADAIGGIGHMKVEEDYIFGDCPSCSECT